MTDSANVSLLKFKYIENIAIFLKFFSCLKIIKYKFMGENENTIHIFINSFTVLNIALI